MSGEGEPGCLVELDDANTLCALDGWSSASIAPAILFYPAVSQKIPVSDLDGGQAQDNVFDWIRRFSLCLRRSGNPD